MSPTFQVQVKRRGRITLPKELRDAHDIEDGVIVMQHKKSNVDQIANGSAQELRKEGITLQDIRKELKKIRK